MRPAAGPLLAALLALPAAANAAGGAHVIDDSEVEQAGHCHLELWASAYSHGNGLANVGPACTPARMANLEIDGFIAHYAPPHARAQTSIGLGPKVTLRPMSTGFGIAVEGYASLDTRTGRPTVVTVAVPFSLPVGPRWTINLNVGTTWVRGVQGLTPTGGGQLVYAPATGPSAMVEVFRQGSAPVGGQAGLRWTVADGRIDLDLLVGRYVDGVSPRAMTLGLTIQR